MAEIAEKPLYRVTCGDIGTEAEEVEKVFSFWYSGLSFSDLSILVS